MGSNDEWEQGYSSIEDYSKDIEIAPGVIRVSDQTRLAIIRDRERVRHTRELAKESPSSIRELWRD